MKDQTNLKYETKEGARDERFYNREITKSLPYLRMSGKKHYALRQKFLDSKEHQLIQGKGLIKDSRLSASQICLQVLGNKKPGLLGRRALTEDDWDKKLFFTSFEATPPNQAKILLKLNGTRYPWRQKELMTKEGWIIK